MIIIPAIDIIKGKCVRLTKGNFDISKTYSNNPLKIAKIFERAGLKKLHLIDLEGAKQGKIKNWNAIKKIVQNTNLSIQFGGGVSSEKDIKRLLGLGIKRIILGSVIVKNPQKFEQIFKKFGKEKIAAALDVKGKNVYCRGWQEKSGRDIFQVLSRLINMGVEYFIVTDILRDGTLKGPNFSLYQKLTAKFPKAQIIASGGVRNIDDFKKLSKTNVFGAIAGKAIYENKISINDLKIFFEKKIIPCLDCKIHKGKWKVVKGIKFEKLRLAGDPINLAKKYSRQGADELVALDISASQEKRKPFFKLIQQISKNINIPLIAGGGVSSLSDIEKLIKSGAEKVSLNTSAVKNPEFLALAIKKFGSEKIIVAIDTKKTKKDWKVCILGGTKETGLNAIKWAKKVEKMGARHVLVTSKDKDGTKTGYDIDFLKKIKKETGLYVIASGGAGKAQDFLNALIKGGADAVLGASVFHFNSVKIQELKRVFKKTGINVII